METDHPSHNKADLSFSLQDAAGPPIEAPSRFARALKRARFARGWTQTRLAEQLAITKRSIISWETATRIPGVGMVILLIDVLSTEGLSLHHELLCAYILDDLERHLQRKEPESHHKDTFSYHLQHVISQVEQIAVVGQEQPSPYPPARVTEAPQPSSVDDQTGKHRSQSTDEHALEPLFALLDQLHRHPEFISVVRDFLRELAPES